MELFVYNEVSPVQGVQSEDSSGQLSSAEFNKRKRVQYKLSTIVQYVAVIYYMN